MTDAATHVFDASLPRFEQEVLLRSKEVPVLVDFWASWCEPCKALGPILEKLANEFNGGFLLAKVDVDQEQQLAGYFQVKSIPTVMLVKDGQVLDGFPGALPEGQLRQFLAHHGVVPKEMAAEESSAESDPDASLPPDPHQEVVRLRGLSHTEPDNDGHKLDLALALLNTGAVAQAQTILDALPANLSQDDRAVRARARLDFTSLLRDAPPTSILLAAIAAAPNDLRARHLLGARLLIDGDAEAALEQFLAMLQFDRSFEGGLPRKSLIDAFRIIDDEDLVGRYRRKMASILF